MIRNLERVVTVAWLRLLRRLLRFFLALALGVGVAALGLGVVVFGLAGVFFRRLTVVTGS